MLISIDWIKDFVKLPEISPQDIGRKFTMATAEVEDVVITGEFLEKIHIVEITKIEKHPDADTLNLVTFKISDNEERKVVCGANNVKTGLKVPYAPVGITLPGGLKLEPKKIRGILSEGMLLSKQELGFEGNSKGLMELPENAPVGTTLLEFQNESKDVILDIDNKSLTHRPDLWGHYGIAREFATLFDSKLLNPFSDDWMKTLETKFTNEKSPITPKLEGESAALSYYGISLSGVTVEESPEWMKKRLISTGLRPINNIVDISNFVMLELGIPLHIFDRDLITGNELIIERTESNKEFITLDEEERKLITGDTIIRDSKQTLVLAGIMGGLFSGVTEKTSNIFIEVANWKASEVRKTSTRLGLRTDSSQRYEKSLDCKLLKRTLFRTLELVLELCPNAKIVGKLEYDGRNIEEIKSLSIKTSFDKINSVLGKTISDQKVLKIFDGLGFCVERIDDNLNVTIPSWRATKDIEYEADLIEEIGRMIGYDNIVPESPFFKVSPVTLSESHKLQRKIKSFMALHGNSFEIMTYPLVGEKLLKKASWALQSENELVILNSISKDQDRMRTTMIPSLLEAAAINQKNYKVNRFFELGRTYSKGKKSFSEESTTLGIVFQSKDQNPFMEMVNCIEKLLPGCNIPFTFSKKNEKFDNPLMPSTWNGTHPFEYIDIKIMGKNSGVISSIHPMILRSFKIKGNLVIALVDISSFENRNLRDKTKYRPLPKFPNSQFDCTVVVDMDTEVETILSSIKKCKIKEIISSKIAGTYILDDNKKSVTIATTFGNPDQTLSGEFIKNTENMIVQTLEKAGFPLKI